MILPSGVKQRFVIVGGGQAGAWVARTVRTEGFRGRILLIGEENHWPYERPPLSKSALFGGSPPDEGALLTEAQARELDIEVRLNQRVTEIDRKAHRIICSNWELIGYDKLVLTTGSRPRQLPLTTSSDPNLFHYLRTRYDANRLKAALVPGERLAVLGAGWIGLEVAASARKLGLEVTVIETASRVCARSVPDVVSRYLQDLHAQHGVEVRTSIAVHSLSRRGGEWMIELNDGTAFVANQILVGIGAVPNVELAKACGLDVDNGVVVDDTGRTSDPDIYAAGDVTAHFNRLAGRHVRLESWANAQSQGIIVGQAMLGKVVSYDEVPWLWSDQFDVNFQIVGFPDQAFFVLQQGKPELGKGCWLMLDKSKCVVGAVAVNAARELRTVRKALQTQTILDLDQWHPTTGLLTTPS